MTARTIATSICRPLARPVAGAGDGGAWTPDQLTNVLQRMDSFAYAASNIGGLPVVESSVGTAAVPRGQRCVLFDGVDDRATTANAGAPSSITICAWVRISSLGGGTVLHLGETTFRMDSMQLRWFPNVNTAVVSASATFNVGQWYHVAIVQTGTTYSFYRDGVLLATATTDPVSTVSGSFQIGSYAGGTFFSGNMYDVRVYSVAKSLTEIQAIRDQHLTPTTIDRTGLLAAWWLNEESGTTHYDWSGNGRHLTATNVTQSTYHATDSGVRYNAANELGYTLFGSVVIPRNEATPTQDAAGGSLQFAGPIKLNATMEVPCITLSGSDYAEVPAIALGTVHTLDCFARFTEDGVLVGNNTHSDNRMLLLFGNRLYYTAQGAGADVAWVSDTNWHRFTVVRNGVSVSFYVDGVQVGSTQTLAANNTLSVTRVSNGAAFPFVGSVSSIRLYSAARLPSSIDAGLQSNAIAIWPIQAGPGSSNTNRTIHDASGNGNHLTVVNGTVATQWANRTNVVRDWCIEYGGSIAANGAFVPGRIGSSLDAAGNTKGIAAGTHGNPYSRFVPNFWSAPSLVNIGSTASDLYAPTDMAGVTAESTADTRYANTRRYLAVRSALTGSDKTNAQGWVA